ncbi:MAG: hypothetical protein WBP41_09875 [Saprospiraceae bacterium]
MASMTNGQVPLGIGLISMHYDDRTVFYFFKDTLKMDPNKIIEFFTDESIEAWNIVDLDQQREWLRPESLVPESFSFILRCLSETNDWFEIIVNDDTGLTMWLRKSDSSVFMTWETYLQGMYGVSRRSERIQKIRISPNEHSKEIKYTGQDCFQVNSMDGDWIEIFTAPYCDEDELENNPGIESGWIRWKEGNNLLIDYTLTD